MGRTASPSDRGAASSNGGVQVIARAAQILRALEGEPNGLSLSQLSERLGLPRSTVHRVVTALAAEGLLAAASPNGRVRLGPELARLALAGRRELRQELRPFLQRLFEDLNETVDCAVLDGDHLRFIDQIAAPHRLRAMSSVGATFPLHCTANGKALLAELTPDEVARVLPTRLRRCTPATITARAELMAELEHVRESKVAFDREEHTFGISAAGIAVRDPFGALAAISVPMPTQRFEGREAELAQALRRARGEILRALGVTGDWRAVAP
jgi:IclR family transcriptional regulator, acetate operon repressor